MKDEIEANKIALSFLSQEQYERFKKFLMEKSSSLSNIVEEELGDISGGKIPFTFSLTAK